MKLLHNTIYDNTTFMAVRPFKGWWEEAFIGVHLHLKTDCLLIG